MTAPSPASNLVPPMAEQAWINPAWPQRSQCVLGPLFTLAMDWLRTPIQAASSSVADQLAQSAAATTDAARRRGLLQAHDTLLAKQRHIETDLRHALAQRIRAMGTVSDVAEDSPTGMTLTLLDESQQDIDGTVSKAIARGTVRGGMALHECGYRLAVLVGQPPLEGRAMPFGPAAIVHAFDAATTRLGLAPAHRAQLLHAFDNACIPPIAAFYQLINQYLCDAGILPGLQAFVIPTVPQATSSTAKPTSPKHSGGNDAGSGISPQVLGQLTQILARQRADAGTASPSPAAGKNELQVALQQLNTSAVTRATPTGDELGSAVHMRSQLLLQVNRSLPDNQPRRRLDAETATAIELIALLFKQVDTLCGPSAVHTRSALRNLQWPIVRIAVDDPHFFMVPEHPAHQLLDTLIQTSFDWLDATEGKCDQTLQTRIDQIINHLATRPQNIRLYTQLRADLERLLDHLRQRALIKERRYVQGRQGRERLDRAHQRAAELLRQREDRCRVLSPWTRILLDQTWTDVLTLSALRHREGDAEFVACLKVADQLLGLAPVVDPTQLQAQVSNGLQRIGMASTEAESYARSLAIPGHEGASAAVSQPTKAMLAVRLKLRQRLGEPAAKTDPPASNTGSVIDLDTVRRRSARGPQTVTPPEVGAWLRYAADRAHASRQRKLAWMSDVSGQALLTNRYGQCVAETSMDALLDGMAHGALRRLPAHASLVDAAWRVTIRNLPGLVRAPHSAPTA